MTELFQKYVDAVMRGEVVSHRDVYAAGIDFDDFRTALKERIKFREVRFQDLPKCALPAQEPPSRGKQVWIRKRKKSKKRTQRVAAVPIPVPENKGFYWGMWPSLEPEMIDVSPDIRYSGPKSLRRTEAELINEIIFTEEVPLCHQFLANKSF